MDSRPLISQATEDVYDLARCAWMQGNRGRFAQACAELDQRDGPIGLARRKRIAALISDVSFGGDERAPPATSLAELVALHWRRWRMEPGHFGLGEHYETHCPPLLVMGGASVRTDRPLVVISLEPLIVDRHYERQVAHCISQEQHGAWNLDYFQVFPAPHMGGREPQPYWSTLHALVAGWAGRPAEPFSWSTFEDNYIEIPFVPLHAPSHHPPSYRAAIKALSDLARERLRLVLAEWPRAAFLILGLSIAKVLVPKLSDGSQRQVALPRRTARDEQAYGTALWRQPIFQTQLARDLVPGFTNVPLFFRAPLTQGHGPRSAGRHWLGARLREHVSVA